MEQKIRKKTSRICSFEGCGRMHNAKGYCASHGKMVNEGKPLVPILARTFYPGKKPNACSVEGCKNKYRAMGFCSNHYNRMSKGLDIVSARVSNKDLKCIVNSCGGKVKAKGLCEAHYQRTKYVPKSKRFTAEKRYCSEPDCDEVHYAKGFCRRHYNISVYIPKHSEAEARIDNKGMTCEVYGCESMARVKFMCSKHYARLKKHGDVNVNYANTRKRTQNEINKGELKFTHSYEEGIIMKDFFSDMGGLGDFGKDDY